MLQTLLQLYELIAFVVLLLVGYLAGRAWEAKHYRSIRAREREYAAILMFTNRFPPPGSATGGELVAGSVVISEDYFKRILSLLYSFFGGNIKSYESLLDRARREAVLRMKAAARAHGASMIINVKFQTFAIPGSRGGMGAVELLAYGTALRTVAAKEAPVEVRESPAAR
jgi:uncharacterized protein YbjQ (UPF0145 family)